MNRQHFTNGDHKFPVSTEALEFIQQQIFLVARLCGLAGTNVIVRQPTTTAMPSAPVWRDLDFDNTTAGLVIIGGKLYPLYGDCRLANIMLSEAATDTIQAGADQIAVRTYNYASYTSSTSGSTPVSSFTTIDTIVRLMQRITAIEGSYMTETAIRALVQAVQTNLDNTNGNLTTTNNNLNTTNGNLSALSTRVQTIENNYKTAEQITELLNANARHHLPKGSIIDWYGTCRAANVPFGFVPCGMFGKGLTEAQLNAEKAEWEEKYFDIAISRIGAFLKISQCWGQVVPDLTDRFIVQAGHDYELGKTDGKNSVALNHQELGMEGIDGNSWGSGGSAASSSKLVRFNGVGNENDFSNFATSYHENRPPFYALYKLIKVI